LCYFDLPDGVEAATISPIPKKSQMARFIRNHEKETGNMVYFVLKNGPFLTLLSVSPYKEDWESFDKCEFPEAYFFAYVKISPRKVDLL
jgi:hypothetical protein